MPSATIPVMNPDGFDFVAQDVGNDDTIDSDVNATGLTNVFTLGIDENRIDVDAGLRPVPPPTTTISVSQDTDTITEGESVTYMKAKVSPI
ncbi:MAG: SdrD B-like domain-containing protein, partial [Chloroflexota bacterium]